MVYKVANKDDFDKQLKNAGNKVVVVDFTATWCGPCGVIGPYFEELEKSFPGMIFLKVDVDDADDVSESCGVNCMPTFIFFKNGKELKRFSGANRQTLSSMVEQYAKE